MLNLSRTSAIPKTVATALALIALLAALAACTGPAQGPAGAPGAAVQAPSSQAPSPSVPGSSTPGSPAAAATPAASGAPPQSATAAPAPASLRPLKVEPATGYVGDRMTISGDGFLPEKEVELQWMTVDGIYVNKVIPDNVEYVERKYEQKRVSLGRTKADAAGRVTASFAVPEDHGETHDIYAVIEGKDSARGGFRILRSIDVSPTAGPVGTPITIIVKGMAPSYYQSTMAVRWDNHYTGFMSAVTTRGTAVAQIRAAGPKGEHTLQVYPASHAVPYLNSHQGPNWHIFGHLPEKFTFNVTQEAEALQDSVAWPEDKFVTRLSQGAARTTAGSTQASPGVSAALEPAAGPILSETTLRAGGLAPNLAVEMIWVTARGNRASGSGWSLNDIPVGQASTNSDGSLSAKLQVPEDLGGWHTVKLVGAGKVLAEVPYYVERSLVTVTPKRVKAGEQFTIVMKGIGWTELDNGVAVTYDNSYVGMACGFNSNGDVTLYLTATGGRGTHLIDIYPMIYEGHPNKQVFNFAVPQLTALQDHPSLALGYRLPIYRLAIEVVE